MSISSATNAYYKTLGYGSYNYTQPGDTGGSTSAAAALKRAQSMLGSEDSSNASAYSSLANTVSETLKGMGLDSSDPVTFNTIMQYRNQLSSAFEEGVKKDLKELGIAEDVKFQLVSDGKDGVKVLCSDKESRQKIEKYLEDNPDRVKEFQKIQALSNVESARKAQGIDPSAIRQRIQIESMTAWFANTGQSLTSIMDFSGGDMSLYSGLNKKV